MGVPQADAGLQQHQQQVWPAAADDVEQPECSSNLLLPKEGYKSSDQQQEGHDIACIPSQKAATAAGGSESSRPATSRLLALHTALWSSGVCCVLLAAFIFALTALLVKLTGGRVPVLEITLIRSSISLAVSLVLMKSRSITPVMGHRENIKWLIPRGAFGATAMTTFYAAILLLPLADGMTLFFLNPCLTAVAAWAIRGEPLGLLGLVGCLCSLVGVVVLVHPPMIFGGHADWGARRLWGTGFGLVSAICCAGAFICIRFVGKSEPAIVVALYFHLSTTVLSVLPLAFGWPQPPVLLTWTEAGLLLGVAAGSFAGQLFMTRGLQLENASLASSLNFSQVLYSYAFGILFFHEHLTLFGVLGSILVALGLVCVSVRTSQPTATAGDGPEGSSSSSSRSLHERTLRLASFQRLLSRARGAEDTGGSSEGVPLTAAHQQEQQQQHYHTDLASLDSQGSGPDNMRWVQPQQHMGLSQGEAERQASDAVDNLRLHRQQHHQQQQLELASPVELSAAAAGARQRHHAGAWAPDGSGHEAAPRAAGQQPLTVQERSDAGGGAGLMPLGHEPVARVAIT